MNEKTEGQDEKKQSGSSGLDPNDAARIADFEAQLKRNQGDALRYAEKLHDRNYQLRQRAQAAEAQIPGEGKAVVERKDADLLKKYKALGSVEEIEGSRGELKNLKKYNMVSRAAEAAGMNTNVLDRLLPDGAKLEIGEAKDGEGKSIREVKLLLEGQEPSELHRYAEANWADFLPALRGGKKEESNGKAWIPQTSSVGSEAAKGKRSVLSERLAQIAEKQSERKPII